MLLNWYAGDFFDQAFDGADLSRGLRQIPLPRLLLLQSYLFCFVVWQGEVFSDIFWAVLWNDALHLHLTATIRVSTQESLVVADGLHGWLELCKKGVLVEFVVVKDEVDLLIFLVLQERHYLMNLLLLHAHCAARFAFCACLFECWPQPLLINSGLIKNVHNFFYYN